MPGYVNMNMQIERCRQSLREVCLSRQAGRQEPRDDTKKPLTTLHPDQAASLKGIAHEHVPHTHLGTLVPSSCSSSAVRGRHGGGSDTCAQVQGAGSREQARSTKGEQKQAPCSLHFISLSLRQAQLLGRRLSLVLCCLQLDLTPRVTALSPLSSLCKLATQVVYVFRHSLAGPGMPLPCKSFAFHFT